MSMECQIRMQQVYDAPPPPNLGSSVIWRLRELISWRKGRARNSGQTLVAFKVPYARGSKLCVEHEGNIERLVRLEFIEERENYQGQCMQALLGKVQDSGCGEGGQYLKQWEAIKSLQSKKRHDQITIFTQSLKSYLVMPLESCSIQ